jgi:parvulin-like peptidyl-prolyl isomerase
MAKRKSRVAEERELTRKEIRLRARDRTRHQRLYIGVGIAIGLALILVIAGAVLQYAVRPNSAIATVGEDRIITRDFWKRLRFEKWQMENQLAQMQQLQAQFGQEVFASQIAQLQSTLSSPLALGAQVLDQMIDDKVISQQAASRNITVSDEEVAAALREEIANGRGALAEPQATETAVAGTQATATAAGWTPTPAPALAVSGTITATVTAFPTPEPPPTRAIISETGYTEGLNQLTENLQTAGGFSLDEYRAVIRMRLLTDKVQEAITAETVKPTEEQVHARHILIAIREPTPAPTDTLTTTATTPLTTTVPLTKASALTTSPALTSTDALTATEKLSESNKLSTTATVTGAATLSATGGVSATTGLTATPSLSTTAQLTPTLPNDPNAPRSEAEALARAQEVRRRLEAGEDFATLAKEYSDDPSSANTGGDLGWFGKGRMVPEFEQAAFSLEPNVISEPIKSQFGYHLIEVLEKDANRPKDEQQLQQERQQAFQTWLTEQKTAIKIDRPTDLSSLLPADMK